MAPASLPGCHAAARFVCRNGAGQGWTLLTSGYCLQETLRNLPKIGPDAAATWESEIQPVLQLVPDALAMGERALVFPKAKDRPVVILSHCGFDTDWWHTNDWKAAYEAAKPYNVVLYMYGHTGTGLRKWSKKTSRCLLLLPLPKIFQKT